MHRDHRFGDRAALELTTLRLNIPARRKRWPILLKGEDQPSREVQSLQGQGSRLQAPEWTQAAVSLPEADVAPVGNSGL